MFAEAEGAPEALMAAEAEIRNYLEEIASSPGAAAIRKGEAGDAIDQFALFHELPAASERDDYRDLGA